MHTLKFFPVGNADSSMIELADDRLLLIDYCHRREQEDEDNTQIDLPEELRSLLKARDRDSFDVVAFSHADDDHVALAEEFFYLEHAEKYQEDDRIKIEELWVPARLLLEEGLTGSGRVIRQEARHRLREGEKIRVFSKPDALNEWLKNEGIDPKDREHLITHAGALVPGFSEDKGEVEIFVHSPFSFRFEEDEEDRNNDSIVLHMTFFDEGEKTRVMFGADAEYEAWRDIVLKTEKKGREGRLDTDVFRTSHHVSAGSIGTKDHRGKLEPIKEVKRLFGRTQKGVAIIGSCKPIGSVPKPPPDKVAADFYESEANEKDGEFLVTMEYPTKKSPKPIVIEITRHGAQVKKTVAAMAAGPAIVSKKSPRFG